MKFSQPTLRLTYKIAFFFALSYISLCPYAYSVDLAWKGLKTRIIQLQSGKNSDSLKVEIHFRASQSALAQKAIQIVQEDFKSIMDYFQYAPRSRVHVMVADSSFSANGFAQVFPRNTIVLHDHPPTGEYAELGGGDWTRSLLVHEFSHIVSLEMTHGILQIFRSIFGSSFKLGGVTPRWFSEGLAVWVESAFTRDGRLDNIAIQASLGQYFLQKNSCQTVDCLDDPGTYPYGKLAYWAGGYFLGYLENKQPGTIRCLVRKNSGQAPFFLNKAFKKCVGMKAEPAFQEFRKNFIVSHMGENTLEGATAVKFYLPENKSAQIKWHKGYSLSGQYLTYLVDDAGKEILVRLNLVNNAVKTWRFKRAVADLSRSSPFMKSDQQLILLDTEFSQSFKRQPVVLDLEHHFMQSSAAYDVHYAFPLPAKQFLSLQYQAPYWKVSLQDQGKEQILFYLPALINLQSPHLLKGGKDLYLGFTVNYPSEKEYAYMMIPLAQQLIWAEKKYQVQKNSPPHLVEVYKSSEPLRFLDRCERSMVFKVGEKKIVSLNLPEDPRTLSQGIELQELSGEKVNNLTDARFAENLVVARFVDPRYPLMKYNESCSTFLENLATDKSKNSYVPSAQSFSLLSSQQQEQKQQDLAKNLSTNLKGYPRLSHFIPQYWMLWYTNVNNLTQAQILTSVSDPKQIHTLAAGLSYYPSLSEMVPNAQYTLRVKSYFTSLSYDKYFYASGVGINANEYQSVQWALGKNFSWGGRFSLVPQIYVQDQKTQDFISTRDSIQVGTSWKHAYNAQRVGNFLQSYLFKGTFLHQNTKGFDGFFGVQVKGETGLQLTQALSLGLTASYGKYFKPIFRSGVLYAGGATSTIGAGQVFHEFYALPLNDAFGTEVSTGRLQLQYRFARSYRGPGLWPFMFKEWRLISGTEAMHADRTFLNNTLFRQRTLYGIYGGLNLTASLFYLLPFNMDLLFTRVLNDQGRNDTGVLFLLKTELFPSSI